MKLIAAKINQVELDQLIEKFTTTDEKYSDKWYNAASDEEIDRHNAFCEMCYEIAEYPRLFDEVSENSTTDSYQLIAGEFSGLVINWHYDDINDCECEAKINVWETSDTDDIENLLNELDPE